MTSKPRSARRSSVRSGRGSSAAALAALGGAAFVVGTAGMLVTAYAVGIALGGPLLTALTVTLDRRLLRA